MKNKKFIFKIFLVIVILVLFLAGVLFFSIRANNEEDFSNKNISENSSNDDYFVGAVFIPIWTAIFIPIIVKGKKDEKEGKLTEKQKGLVNALIVISVILIISTIIIMFLN